MNDFVRTFAELVRHVRVLDALDIIVVAYLIYRLLLLLRGTQAMLLLRGTALVILLFLVSSWLPTFSSLLRTLLPVAAVALVIIFQPELRMALQRLGHGAWLPGNLGASLDRTPPEQVINEVVEAAVRMSDNGHGALLVLERTQPLLDVIRTGTTINGRVSVELIMTIFNPRTPLHDGAVVIREDRLLAASCVLPHSERPGLSTETGMRHRAALGLVERTDAVVIVVSEETRNISLAASGTLSPALQRAQLTERLMELFEAQLPARNLFFWRK